MSKNVYQIFEQLALEHFDLEAAPKYGVTSNSSGDVETIITTDSGNVYKKIRDIIGTPNQHSIKNKWKKAFILPKSPVSIDRIKSALKEHNITLTNDVNSADLILTHDEFHNNFQHGDTIQSTCMMGKLWNYEAFKDTSVGSRKMKNYINDFDRPIIYDDKCNNWFRMYTINSYETLYDTWMLTGMSVNIAYNIEIGNLDVMDVTDCLHASANKLILDEQLVKDLVMQIESYSDDDNSIAGKILPTIDYKTNIHLLWKLAQDISGHMWKFNRNKDVQYWEDQANISDLNYKSAEEMILWLEEENLLTSENFKYLETIVRKNISIHNRDLYVFKIQVKPEYRKYLNLKS